MDHSVVQDVPPRRQLIVHFGQWDTPTHHSDAAGVWAPTAPQASYMCVERPVAKSRTLSMAPRIASVSLFHGGR